MKHFDWTDDRLAELRRLRSIGFTAQEICQRIGCTQWAYGKQIQRMRKAGTLEKLKPGFKPQGMPVELSEAYKTYRRNGYSYEEAFEIVTRSSRQ